MLAPGVVPRGGGRDGGLALVQTIMTLHHGSVTATSAVGRGTTFQLVFPEIQPAG